MRKHMIAPLFAAVLLGSVPMTYAAEHEGQENGKPAESRQEMNDTAESIKNYTVEKRDEAAKKAKDSLDALDKRIDALDRQIEKNWDKMDKAAREQARNTMRALHEQRIKVAEWYGELRSGTAKAWEQTKKGFSDAYKSLENSWKKAEREYQEDKQDKQK